MYVTYKNSYGVSIDAGANRFIYNIKTSNADVFNRGAISSTSSITSSINTFYENILYNGTFDTRYITVYNISAFSSSLGNDYLYITNDTESYTYSSNAPFTYTSTSMVTTSYSRSKALASSFPINGKVTRSYSYLPNRYFLASNYSTSQVQVTHSILNSTKLSYSTLSFNKNTILCLEVDNTSSYSTTTTMRIQSSTVFNEVISMTESTFSGPYGTSSYGGKKGVFLTMRMATDDSYSNGWNLNINHYGTGDAINVLLGGTSYSTSMESNLTEFNRIHDISSITLTYLGFNEAGKIIGYSAEGFKAYGSTHTRSWNWATSIINTFTTEPWDSCYVNISELSKTYSNYCSVFYQNKETYTTSSFQESEYDSYFIKNINVYTRKDSFYLTRTFSNLSGVSSLSVIDINSSSTGSTLYKSDAQDKYIVSLSSEKNGDCYAYYSSITSYKEVDGVQYDKITYIESAIKTTSSFSSSTNNFYYNSMSDSVTFTCYTNNSNTRTASNSAYQKGTSTSEYLSKTGIKYYSTFGNSVSGSSTSSEIKTETLESYSISMGKDYIFSYTYNTEISSNKEQVSILETERSLFYTYGSVSLKYDSISTTYYSTPEVLYANNTIMYTGTFRSNYSYYNLSTTRTYYNTTDYGSTLRLSNMVSSTVNVELDNKYLKGTNIYDFNVTSAWVYETASSEIKTYNTILTNSFSNSYSTRTSYNTYSYTNSNSTTVTALEDRFSEILGITSKRSYYITETVTNAIYNNSTMSYWAGNTFGTTTISTSTSVLNSTFISDEKDYETSTSLVSTMVSSESWQQFNNSLTQLISSTYEQQNDTLIFKSEIATYSTYRISTSYTTISEIDVNYSATNYTDYYNPISYNKTSSAYSTSLEVTTSIRSSTDSLTVTQEVNYTPVYSTVNGIYLTSN